MGKLGEGAFGTVFLAQHKLFKAKFAIKFIKKAMIKKSFLDNNQTFAELDILNELT